MTPTNSPNLDKLGIIDDAGHRKYVYPADVKGRFQNKKPFVYAVLIFAYLFLPWLNIGEHPAIFIDIVNRKFYLLGNVFNAQDFYFVFFFLTGIGFSLILISALWGRLWCGWACPQTVFVDGVFRKLERLIEGNHAQRAALSKAAWTFDKIWRKGLKHAIYLMLAFGISHNFLSYFLSMPGLLNMIQNSPSEHPTAFTWAMGMTGILYFNFYWFREQFCIVLCPYGRLQSALQDRDTKIIGYDAKRGEPRGKKGTEGAGDCVDCKRCIQVCPTGIDIRNGLQMECIGCAACIDACDDIMTKLNRPTGLVRYDSLRGLEGKGHKFWRPRLFYYMFTGALGLTVATTFWMNRLPFEANLLRLTGAPYSIVNEPTGDVIRNQVMLHVINKNSEKSSYHIKAGNPENLPAGTPADVVQVTIPQQDIELEPLGSHQIPVIVTIPKDKQSRKVTLPIVVKDAQSQQEKHLEMRVLGPN